MFGNVSALDGLHVTGKYRDKSMTRSSHVRVQGWTGRESVTDSRTKKVTKTQCIKNSTYKNSTYKNSTYKKIQKLNVFHSRGAPGKVWESARRGS